MIERVLAWGAGSQYRIISEYLRDRGLESDYVYGGGIERRWYVKGTFLTREDQIAASAAECSIGVIAIGGANGKARYAIFKKMKDVLGLRMINLRHHTAFIDATSSYGEGNLFMLRSVIGPFVEIGDSCIFNTNCSVDHECTIENGVHVMGGAVITGRVVIRSFASIGSNATILPDITIGEGAVVGAGAVVTRDVGPYQTVVGVPAKPINSLRERP